MRKNICFFCFFLFIQFSPDAFSQKFCNILWVNENLPKASLNASMDGSSSGVYSLSLQAGGYSTAIRQYEEDMSGVTAISGIYRYWLQYPDEWQNTKEGLKYRIVTNLEVAGSQVPGVKTVVTPPQKFTWNNGCNRVGERYNFAQKDIENIKIEIDRGTAWPGVYTLQLPLKVAYEENKGIYSGQSGGGWREYAGAIKSFNPVNTDNITIYITSKCELTSKYLSVNIGDRITPEEARDGIKKNTSLSVVCNAPANILFSIRAADVQDGQVNKTKCGPGYCTLSFDNDQSQKTVKAIRGTTDVPLSVNFKSDSPVAGLFEGSAVLSMNVL
ncbi:TPA: nuclease PIN [Escherichia coli]|nr:nuclease PIN [Escherichia coli]HAX4856349.1 nuclease PIN [Escherichia coli]HAX4916354.1 nuclease PIN [Escherichia coli]HAX4925293.1 nuclease PIN [Escherichia coli]HAX4948522.1 nuclease PIN [Escherichia coli]